MHAPFVFASVSPAAIIAGQNNAGEDLSVNRILNLKDDYVDSLSLRLTLPAFLIAKN